MADPIRLKEDYTLAKCCAPTVGDDIVGYYSHDNILKVHRRDCNNLANVEQERLVNLKWDDILQKKAHSSPGQDYYKLSNADWAVLEHHRQYGVDYSLIVAKKAKISKQEAFDSHKKLREMGLLDRVEPRIIQYRKGIVDNKWIKHRNHTYYDLTDKGNSYLDFQANDNNSTSDSE
ncbi:MAG: DUF2250 domain-containing protein [candidate division Zixibacteria bacterium]|nr:DUF2250 domain-containing protein [candidate division Zixibacteria bacterium]